MMSDRVVSAVEAVYAALAAGDRDELCRHLSPRLVTRFADGLPLGIGGTHHGPDEAIDDGWWAIGRAFAVVAHPERWLNDGASTVVVTGTYRGTARSTGRRLETGFAHTWTVVDGKITSLVQVTDAAAWRDALEPGLDDGAPGSGDDDRVRFRLDEERGIAHVDLIAIETRNRIDPPFVHAAHRAVRCCERAGARAVLISTAGDHFTVGGDLAGFATDLDAFPATLDAMIGPWHAALSALAALPAPVVCAVQGAAAGGGLGLLWASDVVIAADDLKLTTGFPKLGLSGDGGSTWALPRLVGLRRALQISFDSPVLDAAAAVAEGLVDRVVAPAELAGAAQAETERLAAGPTTAYGHLRRLLRASMSATWPEQLAAEHTAIVDCAHTADARGGVQAFIERRPPAFGGGT